MLRTLRMGQTWLCNRLHTNTLSAPLSGFGKFAVRTLPAVFPSSAREVTHCVIAGGAKKHPPDHKAIGRVFL